MRILTAAEMRAVDRRAVEELRLPVRLLMENAGRAVADAVVGMRPDLGARPVVVVCGRGHNGGDGFVAARHLASRGHAVRVVLLGSVAALKAEEVRANAEAALAFGVPVLEVCGTGPLPDEAADAIRGAGVILDAVFGTGFTPPARGLEAAAIEAMAAAGATGAFVLAVDLPSGLDADRGTVLGPIAPAALTLAFAAMKPAHLLPPARELCGQVRIADISIPRALLEIAEHTLAQVTAEHIRTLLPARPRDAHKGTFGHLLIVAGSRGKTGAAGLTARAALRSGVGLVTVAAPASCLPLVAALAPEIMTEPLAETASGGIAEEALDRVLELAATRDALAVGPGLGSDEATRRLVRAVVAQVRLPVALDADGLNAFADAAALRDETPRPLVATPHPGEAGRLLGRAAREVNEERIASARELARVSGATFVLKGSPTATAAPDGRVFLNPTGNPGMATGGTGDALTGLIGALLAQGLAPCDAAVLGVYLHGLAGDLAAAERGVPGMLASDLIEALPRAFRTLGAAKT